jgi:two-component system cell cycle sensor histidine kinase/response regulator CckA
VRFGRKPDDPLTREFEVIEQAAFRAATLARQLLAFSRKQVLQLKPLDLNAVVSEVAPMLRRLIGEDVELTVSLGTDLTGVLADQGQLEQVLMNLAVSARDAMPSGGRLSLETAWVHLDATFVDAHRGAAPGPHVMVAVSDTGTGMSPEVQSQIFEPFFTTKEVGKGTGLGLSTVYGIVKQHQGYICVESEVGVGSTFRVYLPCAAEPAALVEPSLAPTRQTNGREQTCWSRTSRECGRSPGRFSSRAATRCSRQRTCTTPSGSPISKALSSICSSPMSSCLGSAAGPWPGE